MNTALRFDMNPTHDFQGIAGSTNYSMRPPLKNNTYSNNYNMGMQKNYG